MHLASLDVVGVSKSFGPIQALRDASLSLAAGEVRAVIGENGAGKSTLMNIISGNLQPSAGEIRINGAPVRFHSPADARAAGIVIAPQEIQLVPALSVAENIMLGRHGTRLGVVSRRRTRALAVACLARIEPAIDPDATAGTISVAQQQLVQIARAVATGAQLLIFDEPTASLTDAEAERLFAFIRQFRAEGGAVLYISHRLEEILTLCDSITVLRDGALVGELDPRTTDKDEMIRLMAGREIDARGLRAQLPARSRGRKVLAVRGLSRHGEFAGVSFELLEGEILAIGGLIGSGRSELARCIFAAAAADAGTVDFDGHPVRWSCPADAIRAGLVYLPEERKRDGIFPLLSVDENIALPSYARFVGSFGLRQRQIRAAAAEFIRAIAIKTAGGGQPIANLSGGNQQKALIARWLLRRCRVLILDEPTRGIDVNAKYEIQKLLRELAREGLAILYISSELQEILDVADRVLMMHEGRIQGEADPETATQEQLLALAMQ